ncbi:MAG: hypothetical protein ACTSYK_02190 [Alphaproteobacteria bacterium]
MRSCGRTCKLRLTVGLGLLVALFCLNGLDASAKSSKSSKSAVEIELNKLEAQGNDCQAYFVFDNKSRAKYQELKVDLVVFKPDGVIERRFAMEIAPLEAEKRTVKLFELNETACDEIGSFLLNGVLACKANRKTRNDCLGQLVPSSRVNVELTK